MDTEVSQNIYERFLADVAELPQGGSDLAEGLYYLLRDGSLQREAALLELYRRLAAEPE